MRLIEDETAAAFDRLHPGGALGLAVSGGSDSMAMLHLAALWARARGVALCVATVDHGLRPESAAEAAHVAAAAAALDLPCQGLRWETRPAPGNLQAKARAARHRLLAGWAHARGLGAVALAHTRDDQAETLLIRLERGSGVDGLAAMAPATDLAGMRWIRPLLGLGRADLRDWLTARGLAWRDDPSNDDTRFARVRARRIMAALDLDAAGLAATAARLGEARAVLEAAAAAVMREAAAVDPCGAVHLRLPPLAAAPAETRMRVLAAAFRAAAGAAYPPRRAMLAALWAALPAPGPRSLHGCLAGTRRGVLWIAREPAAAARAAPPMAGRWDGRWQVLGPAEGRVTALGEAGLAALRAEARNGAWQASMAWADAPRAARASTPALWQGARLACAPIAAYGEGLEVTMISTLPDAARLR